MPTTNTTADNLMPNVEQQQQQKIRKKIHWKLLERKNSKYAIIRSSSPNSAKQDLKTFVSENQLQYRRKKHDPLVEFENLFEKLNLNDEELLERADRRDLPAKFQQSYRFFQDNIDYNNKISQPFSNKEKWKNRKPTVPLRKAVRPNVILDDFAFRRYDKNRIEKDTFLPSRTSNGLKLNESKSICYMWLHNYENQFKNMLLEDTVDSFSKNPNLVTDDLLNRRLTQSPAAKVLPPHPPFGIPNSPIISQSNIDYAKAELDLKQFRKQRFRSREWTPHLINDDLAFRNLRRDVRDNLKTTSPDSSYCDIYTYSGITENISLQKLRQQLRPINRSTSLTSNSSNSSIYSSSTTLD